MLTISQPWSHQISFPVFWPKDPRSLQATCKNRKPIRQAGPWNKSQYPGMQFSFRPSYEPCIHLNSIVSVKLLGFLFKGNQKEKHPGSRNVYIFSMTMRQRRRNGWISSLVEVGPVWPEAREEGDSTKATTVTDDNPFREFFYYYWYGQLGAAQRRNLLICWLLNFWMRLPNPSTFTQPLQNTCQGLVYQLNDILQMSHEQSVMSHA